LGSSPIHASANFDTLKVTRDILGGADVIVDDKLNRLIVGGTIMDGAVIQAGAIGSQTSAAVSMATSSSRKMRFRDRPN
jgi:hypothetical protein